MRGLPKHQGLIDGGIIPLRVAQSMCHALSLECGKSCLPSNMRRSLSASTARRSTLCTSPGIARKEPQALPDKKNAGGA